MDQILENCEKLLHSNLDQLNQTRTLVCDALEAVRKAKASINSLPAFQTKEDFISYVIGTLNCNDVIQIVPGQQSQETIQQQQLNEGGEEKPEIEKNSEDVNAESAPREEQTVDIPAETGNRILAECNDIKEENENSVNEKTTDEEFSYPDLETATRIRVDVISSLANDGTFWCVPCTADLRKNQNQISEDLRMQSCSQKGGTLFVKEIDKSTLYCVFSKSENLWLRSFVEKELPEDQVQLRFVDTGSQETFAKSRLTPLPDEFKGLEYLAYYCCLFPNYKGKIPYEAKWKFSDMTKGAATNLYLEKDIQRGSGPITCFMLEHEKQKTDIRLDVWRSVQNMSKEREDFPLPAVDVRLLTSSAPKVQTQTLKNISNNAEDEEKPAQIHSNVEFPKSEKEGRMSPLIIPRKDDESSTASWADLCSPSAVDDDAELEYLPICDFPNLDEDEKETVSVEGKGNEYGIVTTESVKQYDSDTSSSKNGFSGAYSDADENQVLGGRGEAEEKKERKSVKYPDMPIFKPKRVVRSAPEDATPRNERDFRNGARKDIPSSAKYVSDGTQRETLYTMEEKEPRFEVLGNSIRPSNFSTDTERGGVRKPQWRFSIKRLGPKSFNELQLKGLSFKVLYEKIARYIVLFTTQQRLEYSYKRGDFTPMLDDCQSLEKVLSSFDRQPIFVIFVRFDRKYSTFHIGGVGLVTSALFTASYLTKERKQVRVSKFHCDILSTAMMRQEYVEPYQDGDVISNADGIRLVQSIKNAVVNNDVENALEYRGELPFSQKDYRREEKGFGSPNYSRPPLPNPPVQRRNDFHATRNLTWAIADSEGENWDDDNEDENDTQNQKPVNVPTHSETQQKQDNVLNAEPFTLSSTGSETTRDLQAEMDVFGLDASDVL